MAQGNKNQYGLYPKQEAFAQLIAQGKNQAEAYRACYNTKGCDKTVWVNASKLAADTKVSQRIESLRRKNENTAIWTRAETLERLRRIAEEARQYALEPIYNDDGQVISKRHNAQAASVELKSIEQAAKMCGFNEPDKTEVEVKPFRVEIDVIDNDDDK